MYSQSIDRLINILNELRVRCPWDKKQTLQSLRPQTVEELYELTDALENENWEGIKEELGDMLLHILFYSKIGEEQNKFTFAAVIENVCNKLVKRHPHIYENIKVENEEDVKLNWEKIKLKEGKKSVLSGVPNAMPAMTKALSIQKKTKQVGFEWDTIAEVKAKVEEEFDELEQAIREKNKKEIEAEMGDTFFALINYARYLNVDPEQALEKTNRKFINRFQYIESRANEQQLLLENLTIEEMDIWWNEAKNKERNA